MHVSSGPASACPGPRTQHIVACDPPMEWSSGVERRRPWVLAGSQAFRGKHLHVRCCRQPAAFRSFGVGSTCDAAVVQQNGFSGSNSADTTVHVSIRLRSADNDASGLLPEATSCQHSAESNTILEELVVSKSPLPSRHQPCIASSLADYCLTLLAVACSHSSQTSANRLDSFTFDCAHLLTLVQPGIYSSSIHRSHICIASHECEQSHLTWHSCAN